MQNVRYCSLCSKFYRDGPCLSLCTYCFDNNFNNLDLNPDISLTSLGLPLEFLHYDFDCFDVGLNSIESLLFQKGLYIHDFSEFILW